jgi:uncharacterized protein YggE
MFVRIMLFFGCLVLAATAANAQTASAGPTPGQITVSGRGVVRVHADVLHFDATLVPANLRQPTSSDVDGAAEAVAKALRDAGVSDASTGFSGNVVNGPRLVSGSLRKPTREAVDALVKRGNSAAAPFPGVTLQNIAFNLSVDDCGGPESRAQDAALGDARARAERVARAAGLRLGPIVAVNEANAFGPAGLTNCATKPDSSPQPQQRFDVDPSGDVFVSATATVTFAILP